MHADMLLDIKSWWKRCIKRIGQDVHQKSGSFPSLTEQLQAYVLLSVTHTPETPFKLTIKQLALFWTLPSWSWWFLSVRCMALTTHWQWPDNALTLHRHDTAPRPKVKCCRKSYQGELDLSSMLIQTSRQCQLRWPKKGMWHCRQCGHPLILLNHRHG